MLERVLALKGENRFGAELIHAFCKTKPTLHVVNVISSSLKSQWVADVEKAMDNSDY